MVDACVLRHRMSTLADLGAEATWDKDRNVYIVPHLGPLLTLLPGEICMLRSQTAPIRVALGRIQIPNQSTGSPNLPMVGSRFHPEP